MRKISFIITMIISMFLFASSVNAKASVSLKVYEPCREFDSLGDPLLPSALHIKSNYDWTVKSDSSWLMLSKNSGKGNNKKEKIEVAAEKYTKLKYDKDGIAISRKAIVTISSGGKNKTIEFIQNAPSINYSPNIIFINGVLKYKNASNKSILDYVSVTDRKNFFEATNGIILKNSMSHADVYYAIETRTTDSDSILCDYLIFQLTNSVPGLIPRGQSGIGESYIKILFSGGLYIDESKFTIDMDQENPDLFEDVSKLGLCTDSKSFYFKGASKAFSTAGTATTIAGIAMPEISPVTAVLQLGSKASSSIFNKIDKSSISEKTDFLNRYYFNTQGVPYEVCRNIYYSDTDKAVTFENVGDGLNIRYSIYGTDKQYKSLFTKDLINRSPKWVKVKIKFNILNEFNKKSKYNFDKDISLRYETK